MKSVFRFSVVLLLTFIIHSCKKDKATPPIISTEVITEISYNTATSGGVVENDGGASILSRGVCWALSKDPDIGGFKTTESGGLGTFSSTLTDLMPNTTYNVRAYATNSAGTAFGDNLTFTTLQALKATLTTASVTSVTHSSAVSGGVILADNGGFIGSRGVCWDTEINPTIEKNKTLDGSGTGSFTSYINGLTGNTTYYIRSYASNSAGVSYGENLSFKTNAGGAKLNTGPPYDITHNTAKIGVTIESDGGGTISSRGVCWSTETYPTIDNNKIINGSGIGDFTSLVSGLTPNTTYYIRGYATNSWGTNYSMERSFTTLDPVKIPIVSTSPVTIGPNGTTADAGGDIIDNGNSSIIQKGVYWGTSENPEITGSKRIAGSGDGPFSTNLYGLNLGATYYVKAFATNISGTGFGDQISFTIPDPDRIPVLITLLISPLSTYSGFCGGNISDDGGAQITDKGICWSTSENPTIEDSKVSAGSGTGIYRCAFVGSDENTVYYVRAYATNSVGTAYGYREIFETSQSDPMIDIDGNYYKTSIIGGQTWAIENLKTTKLNDGTSISLVSNATDWSNLTSPGYCYYNNTETNNRNLYGALYNWHSVITGKLCPTGWHIPSDQEWITLEMELDMSLLEATNSFGIRGIIQGGMMKETGITHWQSPNLEATNGSSFQGLPAGSRSVDGSFVNLGYDGFWWSSTSHNLSLARFRSVAWYHGGILRGYFEKTNGLSIRCVKDN